MLSSEVQGKVVEAFEVFDHENNKTVDVREVVFLNLSFKPFTQKIISEGGHHSKIPWPLPQRKSTSRGKNSSHNSFSPNFAFQVIGEMEDPEQMGYIHLDRFLPVMSR